MRLLIFQLHPPVLEAEGLVAALQAAPGRGRRRAGLQTQFRVEGERRLPIAIEEDLYWIAQEALNNVRKHAAQHVTVHLRFTAASVLLEVIDDGVGSISKQFALKGGATAAYNAAASPNARSVLADD